MTTKQERRARRKERRKARKEDKKLKPTDIAYTVNDLLVKHFQEIVDYEFTAKMEQDLDDISDGDMRSPMQMRWYQRNLWQLIFSDKSALSQR
jgi:DNA topoisomerase-1